MTVEHVRAQDLAAAANVVPRARKLLSRDIASWVSQVDRYAPDRVDVRRVPGGFSSVVQVADPYCLRFYAAQLDPVEVLTRRWGSVLETELQSLRATLSDSWWQSFTPAPDQPYGIGYLLEPHDLHIAEGDRVTITFEGTINLYRREVKLTPPELGSSEIPFPRPPGPIREFTIGQPAPMANIDMGTNITAMALTTSPAAFDAPLGSAAKHLGDMILDPALQLEQLQADREIGLIKATLQARLRWLGHPAQKSVDVLLDLTKATVQVEPQTGDAAAFYDAFVANREYRLEALVAPVSTIQLAPTISLVGRNAANANVPELPDFDVRVFAVDESNSRQAVCAAFDVVPGCVGTIEDVRHFIGSSDYGVIHNEYVLERVLHHKWNRGGFDRSVGVTRRVSLHVQRNGNERDEDADVYGRLRLDTLDTVAIEPHPDQRRDFVLLGGSAEGIADRVVFVRDGTTVTPANADLGPPEPVPWAVDLDPNLHPVWSSDPELRQFQERAHQDGIRHLSRPFARCPEIGGGSVEYVRTEAIAKRFFVLGSLQIF
jgi:hypothetical protein